MVRGWSGVVPYTNVPLMAVDCSWAAAAALSRPWKVVAHMNYQTAEDRYSNGNGTEPAVVAVALREGHYSNILPRRVGVAYWDSA